MSSQDFYIRVVRAGNRWHAHITQGVGVLGEPGSTTYGSRSASRTTRKAMRTVAGIVAAGHMTDVRVQIAYDQGGLDGPGAA